MSSNGHHVFHRKVIEVSDDERELEQRRVIDCYSVNLRLQAQQSLTLFGVHQHESILQTAVLMFKEKIVHLQLIFALFMVLFLLMMDKYVLLGSEGSCLLEDPTRCIMKALFIS